MDIDPLFEFDAPQTFIDLSAPHPSFPPGEHDPWFDQVHPEHSMPLDELVEDVRKQNKLKRRSLGRAKENQQPNHQVKRRKILKGQRKPLREVGNISNTKKKDVYELLKKHNKKFKTTHTYEPPLHSVRDVKQWERKNKKSYYTLSVEERVQANEEITAWKQQRQAEKIGKTAPTS